MFRHLRWILFLVVIVTSAASGLAQAQIFNFMMDVISTGARYNRVEPIRAINGTVQGFHGYLMQLRKDALVAGIPEATFDHALSGLSVGHLADRFRGGQPFVASWPQGKRILGNDGRAELQTLLSARGFDTGGIDVKIGPKTQGAVRNYQSSVGLIADGFATERLLKMSRNDD